MSSARQLALLAIGCITTAVAQVTTTTTTSRTSDDEITISRPIFSDGKWSNPPSFNFKQATAWQLVGNFNLRFMKWSWFNRVEPVPPTENELNVKLPVATPEFSSDAEKDNLRATWIGHATVLVEMDGVRFVTDPIFSDRASPVSFSGPIRFRPPPIDIDELPTIDFVVISHSHYDHLDYNSVLRLNQRFAPDLHWFVPMGLKSWMESSGCSNVHELNWDQAVQFSSNITVRALPAQHWSLRSGFDRDNSLWCSWLVSSPSTRVFFAGDSGFCEDEYRKIGQKYGPFDLAALPIGCYEPREIMSSEHMNVDEAVSTHNLLGARHSLGIHWATFPMGCTENWWAPYERLSELTAAGNSSLSPNTQFNAISPGRTWKIK